MSKFKLGDRVKVIAGFIYRSGQEAVVEAVISDTSEVLLRFEGVSDGLYYYEQELELIKMQEKKTKTVKKYAFVWKADGNIHTSQGFCTKEDLIRLGEQVHNDTNFYHIVPTLFIEEEEVPVQTETVYNFICYNGVRYYATQGKYKDLETAKIHTYNEAIQQIDSSAEEVEIE